MPSRLVSYYKSIYEDVDVYKEYISNVKSEILQIPVYLRSVIDKFEYGNWIYKFINNNHALKLQSDSIEKGCVYAVNGIIQGSIIISEGTLTIPEDLEITVDGTVTIPGGKSLQNYGDLTITGNLEADSDSYWYNYGTLKGENYTKISYFNDASANETSG